MRSLKELSKIKHWYGFKYLLNPEVHQAIFDKLRLEDTYRDTTKFKVLDLYPGPSQQSAIFYNRFKPQQYVLMESRADFLTQLKNEYSNSPIDVIEKDPYDWSSYVDLIDQSKKLQIEKQSLDHINDSFLTIGNLTNPAHEGLLMQWYSCIGNRNWLQRFGRVKMLLWVPTSSAVKLLARPGSISRSKCSVVREAFTETNLVALSDTEEVKLFDDSVITANNPIIISDTDIWQIRDKGISLLEINPTAHHIDLDNWEYVTKHLLILKGTPLIDALESLGHGAKDYFKGKITNQDLLNKSPNKLTNEEFIYLTDLFAKWPFKPDIFMDFVDIYQDDSF